MMSSDNFKKFYLHILLKEEIWGSYLSAELQYSNRSVLKDYTS